MDMRKATKSELLFEIERLNGRLKELESRENNCEISLQNCRMQEDRFRALYMGMPVPALTWQFRDDGFFLADYNEAAADYTGDALKKFIGVPATEVYSDRPDIVADISRCYRGRQIISREMSYRLFSTGEDRYISYAHAYVPSDLVLSHILDITEIKEIQDELSKSRKELSDLYEKQLNVLETERKRIALELHDGVGQYLSSVKISAENLLGRLESKGMFYESGMVSSCVDIVKEAIRDVRKMSMDLRPSILDDLGIIATINWSVREFSKMHSAITVHNEIEVCEDDVPERLDITIYRILQEALNNIVRHSDANQIWIRLAREKGGISMVIRDNGRGFVVGDIYSGHRGLGIAGMRERAKFSGGSFKISSKIGLGTYIKISWQA